MWHVHVGDCGVCIVGKMSKDIGIEVRKGTVVSLVPTLFGYFLGIPSLYVFSFFTSRARAVGPKIILHVFCVCVCVCVCVRPQISCALNYVITLLCHYSHKRY